MPGFVFWSLMMPGFTWCLGVVAPKLLRGLSFSRVVRSQSFDRWCERLAGLLNRSALALLDAVCLASAESIAWMTESRGDVPLRCNVSSGRTPNRNATQIGGTSAPLDPGIMEAQACPYGQALDSRATLLPLTDCAQFRK